MNGGPYRAPQPAERRVINRSGGAAPSSSQSASGAAYRQPDEPLSADELAPRAASRAQEPHQPPVEKKSKKGLLWISVIFLIVTVAALAGWLVWSNAKSGATGIDSSRYQAVFLSNDQIYFGKLSAFNNESFKITRVYYPEAQTVDENSTQKSTASQGNIKLIPIVDGIHGPEDEMIISKSQILYYENLKADSQVAQLIERQSK